MDKYNISGTQINNWFIIKQATKEEIIANNKDLSHIYYLCRCVCGTERLVSASDLRLNKSKSCGCIKFNKNNSKNIINEVIQDDDYSLTIINHKFGKLLPIQRVKDHISSKGKKYKMYECICDCGNHCIVRGVSLVIGHTTSCGKCQNSKGEEKIKQILNNNNIHYEIHPELCVNTETNRKLYADFKIDDYYIEFDGIQHFECFDSSWNTEEKLVRTQYLDNIKNNYCKENNIGYIRIPYYHIDNLCLDDLLIDKSMYKIT